MAPPEGFTVDFIPPPKIMWSSRVLFASSLLMELPLSSSFFAYYTNVTVSHPSTFCGCKSPCPGLVTCHIEEGQNSGAYDTQETLLVFLVCMDPHILHLPITMPIILTANCSL